MKSTEVQRRLLHEKYIRYSTDRLNIEIGLRRRNSIAYKVIHDILNKRSTHNIINQEIIIIPVHFGNKNEPYFTEKEALNGFKCSIEDLSESEKEMYSKIENYGD